MDRASNLAFGLLKQFQKWATQSYNRDVFALPGRTTDAMSKGCNMLIKTQQAHVITSVADLVYILNWDKPETKEKTIQPKLFLDLSEGEQKIYDNLIQKGKQDLDSIAIDCKVPTYKLASLLLNLELKGVVQFCYSTISDKLDD